MNLRFTITLIHYCWSCGDGCCSDSGYKINVEDHQPENLGYGCVFENVDWDSNPYSDSLMASAIEAINEKLGRPAIENQDYIVIEDYQDSNQEMS